MTRQWRLYSRLYPVRLLETTIQGATHVIINISGDISLMDANDAASYVQELTGEDANIIFGAMYDDSVADYARIQLLLQVLQTITFRTHHLETELPILYWKHQKNKPVTARRYEP